MLNEYPTPERLPADVLELTAETMARIYGPMRYECLTCRTIYASFNDYIMHHDPACAAPCLHPWRDRRDARVLYPIRHQPRPPRANVLQTIPAEQLLERIQRAEALAVEPIAPKVCAVPWCMLTMYCKGLCDRHYRRQLLYGDPCLFKRRGRYGNPLIREIAAGTFEKVVDHD